MKKRPPDFLIVGAMKAGTTSLADALRQHPEVFITREKEVHLFNKGMVSTDQIEEYLKHFQSDKKYVGSAPQGYTKTHLPMANQTPLHLKAAFPKVKLIYLVRDPMKRMISHFQEHFCQDQRGGGRIAFDPKLNPDLWEHSMLTSSYGLQLNNFLAHFSAEQILVLRLEDFLTTPEKQFNKICGFLDVTPVPLHLPRSNSSEKKYFLSPLISAILQKNSRLHRRLRDLVFRLGLSVRFLRPLLLQPAFKMEPSPQQQKSLIAHFKRDVLSLKHPSLRKIIMYDTA